MDNPPLGEAYRLMRQQNGHLNWWPGETPFEICVGAILTQNTSWRNVELAILRLKKEHLLSPHAMAALSDAELADWIKPAGCPQIKARRLRAFLDVLMGQFGGQLDTLLSGPVEIARARLLAIHGVGPETADCMLLYGGNRPSFVIDSYTRRIFSRHGWCEPTAKYENLRSISMSLLRRPTESGCVDLWQDYHAQLVQTGKDFCLKKGPNCVSCPLKTMLSAHGPHCSE